MARRSTLSHKSIYFLSSVKKSFFIPNSLCFVVCVLFSIILGSAKSTVALLASKSSLQGYSRTVSKMYSKKIFSSKSNSHT
jgi:hypothetical protein